MKPLVWSSVEERITLEAVADHHPNADARIRRLDLLALLNGHQPGVEAFLDKLGAQGIKEQPTVLVLAMPPSIAGFDLDTLDHTAWSIILSFRSTCQPTVPISTGSMSFRVESHVLTSGPPARTGWLAGA